MGGAGDPGALRPCSAGLNFLKLKATMRNVRFWDSEGKAAALGDEPAVRAGSGAARLQGRGQPDWRPSQD